MSNSIAFNSINSSAPSSTFPLSQSLSISAPPGTDLWRKPPSIDVSNAPYKILNIPAASFRRARVTVNAPWERKYDQGGLVLFLPAWPESKAWVKAGIEYYMGEPCVSVVAARVAADWSLRPGTGRITLEMERETEEERTSLWVYVVEDGVRTAVREVTWVFADEKEIGGMMSIGLYAARPTKVGDGDMEELSVTFEDIGIDFEY